MAAPALYMTWADVAFLHWPVAADVLRPLVPAALELETYDGSAWIGVVPFEMRDVRVALAPPLPGARDFPELNVRTYVRHRGRGGVYFFSLDAASWLAVAGARVATGLPYWHARMAIQRRAGGGVRYESRRAHPGAPAAEFVAEYQPAGPAFVASAGSFEHWSTERYALFTRHAGSLWRLDVEHERWPLQPATAAVERNSMAAAAAIPLPAGAPHVLFAARLAVVAFRPQRV